MSVVPKCLVLAVVCVCSSGCSSFLPVLLPERKERVETPWQSFESARQAFDGIVPNESSMEELRGLGFHPGSSPNISILSYMDVFERFVPNNGIRLEDQDPGVQECVSARERCYGWQIQPSHRREKRYGNVLLDFFTFRRRVATTGWSFKSLVVVVDDRIVYKLWEGNPSQQSDGDSIRPLGPLQDIFFVIDVALTVLL